MDTAYGIFEYNENNFFAYISYQTNTPLSAVKQKTQITYLCNYLLDLTSKKIFFIYENEYIDKHYIEDYASYYVRCFKNYKKTCSRIHFFETDKDDVDLNDEFGKALNGDGSFINNKNYLGYIVIRPIPQTFLAKVCLKPYYVDKDRQRKYILTKKYKVSLFGIKLSIDTIAFQEQDKIISACATTSLWSFFHAHPKMNLLNLPSSNLITKSAYPENNGLDREFPNSGLSTEMICRSLRAQDFSPEYFEFSDENLVISKKNKMKLFKEYIYAYCSSGLPLILGVSVKDFDTLEEKGLHAVTIVGYSLNKTKKTKSSLLSHKLDKIYVNDDRFGPFLRIVLRKGKCEVEVKQNDAVTTHIDFSKEIYIPDTLIIGVYHKIRIPYLMIKNTCLLLVELFSEHLVDKKLDSLAELIKVFDWDIHIKENSNLKSDIFKRNISNKEEYLTKSLPKYIWSATAIFANEEIFELIFDATDIDQGTVFLEFLPINTEYSESIREYLEDYFESRFSHNPVKEDSANLLWGMSNYFKKKETYLETLTSLFGYLTIPTMIKPEEMKNDNIINQCAKRANKIIDKEDFFLDRKIAKGATYIWVIDKEGFLCVGVEKTDSKKGHPTLTDGMPARIGGEMKFNEANNTWEINPFSGRYSSEYGYEEKKMYVDNVITYKFSLFFPEEKFKCAKFKKQKT